MNKQFEGQLSPQENYDRETVLACPLHDFEVLPAAVCPICRWPEEQNAAGIAMWNNVKAAQPMNLN